MGLRRHWAAPCLAAAFVWQAHAGHTRSRRHRDQRVISSGSGEAKEANEESFPDLPGLADFHGGSWRGLKFLASGSIGQAWYGQHRDESGKWISKVVKLLVEKVDEHGLPIYWTRAAVLDNPARIHPSVKGAKRECEIAQDMSEYLSKAWHERHVIHCFKHNIPNPDENHANQTVVDRREVLYLLLEYGGPDLWSLMDDGGMQTQFTAADVFDVHFKLVEALEHLARHGIIHHDVKPDNVVIKTVEDFPEFRSGLQGVSYQVLLIDFGGFVNQATGDPCERTSWTSNYGPGELFECQGQKHNSACECNYEVCPSKEPDDHCPTNFDMFSQMSVLAEMLQGSPVPQRCADRQDLLVCFDEYAQREALSKVVFVRRIWTRWSHDTPRSELFMYEGVLMYAIKGWRLHPSDRTTAAELKKKIMQLTLQDSVGCRA